MSVIINALVIPIYKAYPMNLWLVVLALLPVGAYRLTVAAEGFRTAERAGVVLQLEDRLRADFPLVVGALTETVEVRESLPVVQTESAERGTVIDNAQIVELPLNGRNFTSLMTLVPGTIRTNPVGVFDAPQGNSSFAVNGQRDGANNYMIDGADNNEVLLGIVTILPPPEAIGEFKLQTNAFSAEFGRAGGAVVNVQTRSGTNRFRGSLYEFFRNNVLDARGPFDQAKLPPLRQNEFGGTLGIAISPNSALAANAYYWSGYAHYAKKDCKSALEQQQRLVASYPQSPKVPDALLNIASCQLELKDTAAAKKNLQDIVARYPGSNAAAIAGKRLELLK